LDHVQGVETHFTKGPNDESITLIGDEDQTYLRVKHDSPAAIGDISQKVVSATRSCLGLKGDEYMSCVMGEIETDFKHVSDSKERLETFYGSVSHHLRNYTCKDPTMDSTPPIFDYDYELPTLDESQKKTLKVNVHLDTSHAKIWTVDNFITDDECKILMDHGRPKLRRATVAAEDGTSIVSENRKAQQASYDFVGDQDPLE